MFTLCDYGSLLFDTLDTILERYPRYVGEYRRQLADPATRWPWLGTVDVGA